MDILRKVLNPEYALISNMLYDDLVTHFGVYLRGVL